jgi:hypothetical protein
MYELDTDNYLDVKYGVVPAPTTMAALLLLMPLPEFRDDPTSPGMVILEDAWVDRHIVYEWFPLIGQRQCNRFMAPSLYAALAEIAQSPYADYIKPKQCGIFVPRRNYWKSGYRLSTHGIGMAIDINWNENPVGVRGGPLATEQRWVTNVFKKHGFYWGGDWKHPDEMHFQFLSARIHLPRR